MKLKISAKATVLGGNDSPVRDAVRLGALDGITHDECFSDYFLDDPHTKALPAKGVSGGYLRFRFRSDRQELWAETEYDLREPLTDEETKAGQPAYEFLPSAASILDELVPMSFRVRLFKCFLDAAVSEQIARMVAMKAATENADDMISHLSTAYNRARQGQITGELLEIIGGAEALNE